MAGAKTSREETVAGGKWRGPLSDAHTLSKTRWSKGRGGACILGVGSRDRSGPFWSIRSRCSLYLYAGQAIVYVMWLALQPRVHLKLPERSGARDQDESCERRSRTRLVVFAHSSDGKQRTSSSRNSDNK